MDIIKEILVNVFTSGAVLGLFAFITKQYVDKWLSTEFEKRSIITQHTLSQGFRAADTFLEKELGIYPEILELIYRLRNIMRDGIEQENAYEWDPQLRPLCGHLTENLYKYRLFIADDVFEKLHKFKQISQDAILLRDMFTRDDNLFQKGDYKRAQETFRKRFEEADILYEEIASAIRQKLLGSQS